MPVVDVEKLIRPVSDDAPCGENLEYDATFIQMEKAKEPKPSQQVGDTGFPGEEPELSTVKSLALELLDRTRDLRVLLALTHAVLHTDGLPSFKDCCEGFEKLVDERWEGMHPQLDPDDGNDPTLRVNLIAALNDDDTTIRFLRDAEMVKGRMAGRFTYRDYEIATGDLKPVANTEGEPAKPSATMDMIMAAFSECELEELQANADATSGALEAINKLETRLTAIVGVAQATSLTELRRVLKQMSALYAEHLTRRGVGVEPEGGVEGEGEGGVNGEAVKRLSGEITSREDVIRAIDKICDYYARHEPSSPLPLLLRRAKRLANKSFLEIVRDLSPEALQQVLALGGEEEEMAG
jgi:type VI secretion system protein ImpA